MNERPLSFGLWYDFRNPAGSGRSDAEIYAAVLDQVAYAERLGFDDIWLSEHHFVDDAYSPSMLAIGCAIAARTKRVRIGTSVLLLPLHDPVRVAEDAATLDVISNGRLELGLGVGYRVEEFSGFNVDASERAQRMDEGIEIIQRLFAGERLTFEGRHYTYRDIQLFPQPVQRPPKLWIAGFSNVAVRRAARVGHGYIATGPISPFANLYWDQLRKEGRDPAAHEIAGGYMWLHVARDPDRRWAEAMDAFAYQLNCYAGWFKAAGMDFFNPVRAERVALEAAGFHIVTPDLAIGMIRDYVAATGTTRWYSWAVPPGLAPEWSNEHLELFAREVIPAFR
jgi:probable F420-dependent oxidoreductase